MNVYEPISSDKRCHINLFFILEVVFLNYKEIQSSTEISAVDVMQIYNNAAKMKRKHTTQELLKAVKSDPVQQRPLRFMNGTQNKAS